MLNSRAGKLIRALAAQERALRGTEFLSPLTRTCRARVRIQELIYEFAVQGAQPGWWICRVRDERSAEVVSEALAWQRGEYLALWPMERMVLLEDIGGCAWLAVPFSPAAAVERGSMAGPQTVQLVEGGQPFARIIARVEGATRWYDAPDRRGDPAIAERLRAALNEEDPAPHAPGMGAGERIAYALLLAQRQRQHQATATREMEARLWAALTIAGARLLGYARAGGQIRVTWEREGRRSVTLIDPDLTVASAGICLSGEDRQFDLASIVGVVRNAPTFARFDAEQED